MTYFYEKIIMSFLFSYKHEIEMERELPMLFAAGFHTMYLRTKGTNFFHICISHSQPLVGFVRQQKQIPRLFIMGKKRLSLAYFINMK